MTTVPFLLAYILTWNLIYNLGSEDKGNNRTTVAQNGHTCKQKMLPAN